MSMATRQDFLKQALGGLAALALPATARPLTPQAGWVRLRGLSAAVAPLGGVLATGGLAGAALHEVSLVPADRALFGPVRAVADGDGGADHPASPFE